MIHARDTCGVNQSDKIRKRRIRQIDCDVHSHIPSIDRYSNSSDGASPQNTSSTTRCARRVMRK